MLCFLMKAETTLYQDPVLIVVLREEEYIVRFYDQNSEVAYELSLPNFESNFELENVGQFNNTIREIGGEKFMRYLSQSIATLSSVQASLRAAHEENLRTRISTLEKRVGEFGN